MNLDVFKNSMNQIFRYILNFLPIAIIFVLIDHRFHNYYWKYLDVFRMFSWDSANFHFHDFYSLSQWYFLFFIGFVFFYFIFLFFKKSLNKVRFRPYWAAILLFLFFGGILFTYLNYSADAMSARSLQAYVWGNYILPLFLSISLFLSLTFFPAAKKLRKSFENSLLFYFSVFGFFVILQRYFHVFPGDSVDFLGRSVWPYIDPFFDLKAENPNWLAYLFGPMSILAFIKIIREKKYFFTFSLITSLFVLFLTKSYTGIFAVMISMFALLFLTAKLKSKIILILIFIVFGSGFVYSQKDSVKFQALLGNKEVYGKPSSLDRRAQIYSVNKALMQENFIYGLGPAKYQNIFIDRQSEFLENTIPNEEIPPHPHNLIVNFWSDLGVFGLLAGILLYVLAASKLLFRKKNFYYLVFSYFLIHGFLDTPFGLEEVSMLFWIILFLALSYDISAQDLDRFDAGRHFSKSSPNPHS